MFNGNIGDLIRKAQEMGENLKARQEELARKEFDVSVGGDMVKMRFNGKGEALSITIDPEVLDADDPRMLEDLVLSAVNEGIREGQKLMQEEMSKMAGGLKIPGLTT
ncbi:MAG: YbaB/EbfC family nucleoid-associated protein [SAR324 cluster bacterium]|nr:YbaB/EbfC family nucleoid-associated protein [SAR324 cluster bacterium]MCZ6534329.1 YbaB/EbfC family nucleoid-associated protein [SAR324 cluster bacterium]MCZ6557091.1 YbaB/EbfC family nucleoid-associated protein [SAR324 cluster bacterium]MCZ6842762.1 YbaB/EbfC family nucleoid-associated protein [SAR324 cluster bacterium]